MRATHSAQETAADAVQVHGEAPSIDIFSAEIYLYRYLVAVVSPAQVGLDVEI